MSGALTNGGDIHRPKYNPDPESAPVTPERDEVAGLSALAAFHRGTCITNSPFAHHRDRGCDCGLSAAIKACHFPPGHARQASRIAELEAEIEARDNPPSGWMIIESDGRYCTIRDDESDREFVIDADDLAARARLSDPTGGRAK